MQDKQIVRLIHSEERRQESTLNLIASENYASRDVREALGSVFTNKYSEGYPGKRYYAGNTYVDELETLVQKRALKLFGLGEKEWGVNVQALSGVAANLFSYFALVPPQAIIMAQALDQGGHLSHGSPVSLTSKIWRWDHYSLRRDTERLDYNDIIDAVKKKKPRLIIAGTSAYPRALDFKKFKKAADMVQANLMVDMSHIAGLIAAKIHPSPFPYADIVTTTTHKTLRGPRGALIFYRKIFEKEINRAVFPGGQGGPHNHQTAAIGVCLKEATMPNFRVYAKQVILNARTLASAIASKRFRIVSGGTDTHLILVDIGKIGMYGREAQELLEKAGIVVNKNTIPYDTRSPFDPSGIRLGTPALTTRGMTEKEMILIAELITDTLLHKKALADIRKNAEKLCKKFHLSRY